MNILVTGGASGLGRAIVEKLAAEPGNMVFFTYANSLDAAKELEKQFANCKAIPCDFRDPGSINLLVTNLAAYNIDVLVNNAFTGFQKNYFHKLDTDVFLEGFTQNIMPVLKITVEFIKLARKKRFGKIINIISSAVVNKPPIGWSEYVAGKAYLLSLSNSWAIENAGYNITSNAISPAFMLTNLTSGTDERIIEEMEKSHPLKKLLTAPEVADSVAYLANAPQQINGINLVINAASDIA